jgi:hypothetical protein
MGSISSRMVPFIPFLQQSVRRLKHIWLLVTRREYTAWVYYCTELIIINLSF